VAFDRALFLAAGSGLDTSQIYIDAQRASRSLKETVRKLEFEANMDSAWSKLSAGEYLDARYFAIRALNGFPNSEVARDVLQNIDERIDQTAASGLELENRILLADSLTSYGRYDDALVVAKTLKEIAPQDEKVEMAIRKAEFGRWKEVAEIAFSRAEYGKAEAAIDSALARFPDHPWGLGLKKRIGEEMNPAVAIPADGRKETPQTLSDDLKKDVEQAYKAGQRLFKDGSLEDAVARWEQVEALAPGYKSVREYLVDAYKFLGVELYAQNRLEDAVEAWKKAARLNPDSREITGYIRRTEGEISRLQEISYGY
jgi:tetratricopeptide (TPR) repeat protein